MLRPHAHRGGGSFQPPRVQDLTLYSNPHQQPLLFVDDSQAPDCQMQPAGEVRLCGCPNAWQPWAGISFACAVLEMHSCGAESESPVPMAGAAHVPVPRGLAPERGDASKICASGCCLSHCPVQLAAIGNSACVCLQPERRNSSGLIGTYHPSQTTVLRPVGAHALSVEQAMDSPLSAAAVDICMQADLANLADAGSMDGSAGEEWWRFSCALLVPFSHSCLASLFACACKLSLHRCLSCVLEACC